MEPTRLAANTLWAALALTWLAASVPERQEPERSPRAAAADQASAASRASAAR